MKLKGALDFSLGNFLCLRGFAPMGDLYDMLLFIDQSVNDDNDKFVGFNLRGIKHLPFTKSEVEFAPALKENLEKFFKLK